MKNNSSTIYSLFLIVGDFCALLAAFTVAFILRVKYDPRSLVEPIPALDYFYTFVAVLPFWILVHAFIGLYSKSIQDKRLVELGRLFVGSFIGILVVIGYDFVSDDTVFPARLVPVYGLALAFIFLALFRNIARYVRLMAFSYNLGISNILIVGDTALSYEMIAQLSDTKHTGYRVIGLVASELPSSSVKVPVFNNFSSAIATIGVNNINGIMQTELYKSADKNNQILTAAQTNHIAYRFVPGNTELFVGNLEVELFKSVPVIAVHQTALLGWGRVVKRLFDILAALVALVLAAIPMLVIAIISLLSGSGSVFFRQTRLTRFNQEFTVFKFRTQYKKYDGTTPEQAFKMMGQTALAKQYRANGDYLPNDPRVTGLGRLLRATSLDELPQLFNVLRGDISLVGPRALIPEELAVFNKRHTILSVKSGLTGLAQVSGRRNISFDERRRLDLYYVQNWSFWMDLMIILRTIRSVLGGIGAR